MSALVTYMIATRERASELEATLTILQEQRYPHVELLVVDGGSTQDIRGLVARLWPEARFVDQDPSTRGLVPARSQGMRLARGEIIVSLDDDSCFVDPDATARIVELFARDSRLGIATFAVHHASAPPSGPSTDTRRFTQTFIGCGHALRASMVRELGGYRDFYEYYGEEAEYALRALDAGWRIEYVPEILVHHRVSAEGRSEGRILGHSLRNHLWTAALDLPMPRALTETAWKTTIYFLEAARRFEPRWYWWALVSYARGLPRAMRLRRPVSRGTLRRVDACRLRDVRDATTFENPDPIRFREQIHWFRSSWLNRRRGRAFWDKRPGGVGRARGATFASKEE